MANFNVRYCLNCGSLLTHQELFGKQRPVCSECGWIHFNDPKVAAGVVVVKAGRVLLARRVNEPYQGKWSLPAGFVDSGEDPARAAERECFEETGLKVRVVQLMDVIYGREHRRGADFIIIYRAEVLDGQLIPGDDADQVGFFSFDDLPPLAFRSTQLVLSKKD